MGKTKVFLDTNILISALGWKGKPKVLLEKCVHGELELITSLYQIEELKRVMNYPKFNFTEKQKTTFVSLLLEIATLVEVTGSIKIIFEDPDDDLMLETAINGHVDFLISGDPHLLNLKQYGTLKIVTASAFLSL